MLTFPAKFEAELNRAGHVPSYILKLLESEMFNEQTLQADWTANSGESNVDYTPTPPAAGDVILGTVTEISQTQYNAEQCGGPGEGYGIEWGQQVTTLYDGIGPSFTFFVRNPFASITNVKARIYADNNNAVGTLVAEISGTVPANNNGEVNFQFPLSVSLQNNTKYWISIENISSTGICLKYQKTNVYGGGMYAFNNSYLGVPYWAYYSTYDMYFKFNPGRFAPSGYIRTRTMDVGSTPTVDGVWKFEHLVPNGTSITYEAWASDTGAFTGEETSLGIVIDGQAITVRKRYYRVKATLFSDYAYGTTPTLGSIMARFPTYISVTDNPILGHEGSLLGISALSTKIDDFEPPSVGQVTATLAFTQMVSNYLKTKYPKNDEVKIYVGFIADGFMESDYVEHYTGLVDDWEITDKDEVLIRIKDFSKEWDVPVPAKWQSAADNKIWTSQHPVDVMLDILRGYVGITDSRIDQDSFNNVKLATSGWVVTRTITGTTISAKDLLEELRQLLSAYFIPQPNGRIKLKRWDASEAAVGSLEDVDCISIKWAGNAASLINQFNTYYNWDGDGDNLADFTSWDLAEDATSRTNWKERRTKEIKDRWTRSAQSAQVVDRRTKVLTRYANPPELLPAVVDLRYMRYETGDILNITTLRAPSTDMNGIASKPFQIVQKTPDFARNTISLKLLRRDAA